jgi:hypothetical protein
MIPRAHGPATLPFVRYQPPRPHHCNAEVSRRERGVPHSFVPPTRETERREGIHLTLVNVGLKGGQGAWLNVWFNEHIQCASTWTVWEVRRASNAE